jgi:histidine triad (HIT) family protein
MAGSCIFCEIAAGRADAAIIFADDRFTAFLDARPVFLGHVLVVPNQHVETLPELPQELIEPLFLRAQALAAALPVALGCEGTFVAMNNKVSQSVPHLHVHVVPRTKGDGLRGFFWPRIKYGSTEEMEQYRTRIAQAFTSTS